MNIALLKEMIEQQYINVNKHPTAELYIYNYAPKVQYEKFWNEVTLKCRGLILDADYNIVANTFPKFFNIEEHDSTGIPNLPFDAYVKMDGSFGVLYWLNDVPYIASRGSFTSEQSQHATKILHEKYSHLFDKIDKSKTYMFEIIYPTNRIVVDYGDMDDLVLLSVKELVK